MSDLVESPEPAALKQIAKGLLVAYVSGDDVLQAVKEDYPSASPEETLALRNEVMRLVRTASVDVSWPEGDHE